MRAGTTRRTRAVRGVMSVAAVAVAGLVLVAATGAFAAKTKAPKDCTVPRVEPSRIVIGCADFSSYVDRLEWGAWRHQRARGHGRFSLNDCKPNCASGTTRHYRARVRLTDPKRTPCNGHNVKLFTKMHLRFPHKQPPHERRFRTNKLFCNP